jgi:hypothetical protein
MARKLHVVLDMDQTLLFGSIDRSDVPDDQDTYAARFGMTIHLRPNVRTFLQKSFASFASVSLYSAASKEWIDEGLKAMGPICVNFNMIMDKTHLRNQLKDLRMLYTTEKGLELCMDETNTILVDDCVYHGTYQPDNIINILPYDSIKKEDNELESIYEQLINLQTLICQNDVDARDVSKLLIEPVRPTQKIHI